MNPVGGHRPEPRVPVPSDGFRQAFAQGRARRRRRIAWGGSAGALGLSAVVLAATTVSGGPSVLVQADEPTPAPSRSASASPAATASTGPEASASPAPTAEPSGSAVPTGSAEPAPTTGPAPSDEPAAGPGPSAGTRPVSAPVRRDYESPVPHADPSGAQGPSYTMCGVDGSERPSNAHARWCGRADVLDAGASSGPAVDLQHRICRASDGDQPTLHFQTSQEVEYEIWRAGELIWRWSDGATVTHQSHELPAEPGACYDWRTRFSTAGLAPGEHVLRAWVTAAELGAEATYETTFTIAPPDDREG